ncbi:MAG TPA: thiamine pyrophosphate-dependent enzyme [Candidatus Limnocylindria bacterium]|nr:thiamine pyrophosphate-dependent enzyme [Candidatus Limnocylindria bacterium]
MPEAPMAELGYKDRLKLELFPTIWCPGCGIGTIMMMLAMTLDEMGLNERNTIIVTGIGCTGRMGGYLKHEAVYTLHGRTLPVAEAIKTVRPEMNVIVVAGDGDTASIGGNHLIHSVRRNAPVTVLCNNNEIYGLTGGQTGPTTPTGTKTLSSPGGNPNTPINLQGLVRSSPHALYAKTTVYHQLHMRNAIKEAIEWSGFSFVDITSQCIENNGRRIGFASANEMLTFYRKTYRRAPKDAEQLDAFEIGIVYPLEHPSRNGNGQHPEALPEQPAGPMTSATESPGEGGATAPEAATATVERTDDEKARRKAESQERAALMAKLPAEVKMRVAKREVTLAQALADAGLEIPEWARTGASAPAVTAAPPGTVEISETGADPATEEKGELDAQKAEAAAEARDLVGGAPGGDTQPVAPRTAEDAKPASVDDGLDPKEAKRVEAQRKLALMQRLPSELKLRVAKREISLEDAMREAGIEPE